MKSSSRHPGEGPAKKTAAAETQREPRGERRKRDTRARLLQAALRLMAEKGMDSVAITEITEAADVGFGSFYNYFESKEAIYAALLDWGFGEFAATLARLVRDVTDPAEIVSVCVRQTLLRAQREPSWGQFLVREGLSANGLERGLGLWLLQDIETGVKTKRFPADDILMMCTAVGGMVLASISMELQFFGPSPGTLSAALERLGFSVENLPERAAATALRTLGLDRTEAEAISRRKLPSPGPA